jgi:hypothetical protein
MTSPRVGKRGFLTTGAVVAVVVTALVAAAAGTARADLSFRKKAPASAEAADSAGSPSGGEPGAEAAAPAVPSAPQAEDKDYPELQAEKDKKVADAALARQARNAQLERDKQRGEPLYKKWEFWAITGAVLAGAVLTVWGGSAVWHQIRGGDVQPCPTSVTDGCFGAGRAQ